MAMVRHYRLQVAIGRDMALLTALRAVVATLRRIDGFKSAALLQDADTPDVYIFSEHWSSREAYRQGAPSLPKAAFIALMETLSAPPSSASFDTVSLDAGD